MLTPAEVGQTCQPVTRYPYSSRNTDVWDILKESDTDPDDSSKVRLIYTNYTVDPGVAGEEYKLNNHNREHLWCKSLGNMTTSSPGMGTDVHNLICADPSVNSTRNNKFYDYGGRQVKDNSPADGYSGDTECFTDSDSFEPPDSAKGIVARAVFYMACCYAKDGLQIVEEPNGDLQMGKLSVLTEWNDLFPPTDWEKRRNRVICKYQGNSNPFIDDYTLVNRVTWTDP